MEKKKFICQEQLIQDVMNALKVVQKSVPLIKRNASMAEESSLLSKKIEDLRNNLQILSNVADQLTNEDIKSDVNGIFTKYEKEFGKMNTDLISLESDICSNMQEVGEYLKYSEVFYYIEDEGIVDELVYKAVQEDCSEEEFFAIVILLCNNNINYETVSILLKKYEIKDNFRKHILCNLKDYDEEAIIKLIK